jgi:hypothetical protein
MSSSTTGGGGGAIITLLGAVYLRLRNRRFFLECCSQRIDFSFGELGLSRRATVAPAVEETVVEDPPVGHGATAPHAKKLAHVAPV